MKTRTSVGTGILLVMLILSHNCANDGTRRWNQGDGFRWAQLSVPWRGSTGFTETPPTHTGIEFANQLSDQRIMENRVLLSGSGVAIGDVDGDGLADIYFCGLDGPNVLYKNLGGWKFEDITDSSGAACENQFSNGALLADVDGDTDLDLLVTCVEGPTSCFLNDGSGVFTETPELGPSSAGGALSMAMADIEGDGDLDLYVATYKKQRAQDLWPLGALSPDFIVESAGDSYRIAPEYEDHFVIDIRDEGVLFFETGEPDWLFLNDGRGHFSKVPSTDGRFLDENGHPTSQPKDLSWLARLQDMDGDGDPDLYVCNNLGNPDRIWINDGSGRFQAIPARAIRSTSNSSLAVDFSDIDRDGDQDFLVADILSRTHWQRMRQKSTEVPLTGRPGEIDRRPEYMRNTLFLNRGDNTYAEIAQFSGLEASGWSRSILFLDVDLDGFEDLLVATGHFYNPQDPDAIAKAEDRIRMDAMILQFARSEEGKAIGLSRDGEADKLSTVFFFPKLDLPNAAFRNRGDLTFEEVGNNWGFDSVDISQGMALGDLDNDGDLDVVVNRLGAEAAVYRNESADPRIAIRLRGLPPNTQGIGAQIRVLGGPVPQSKEVISGGTYLSSSDPQYTFATRNAKSLTIEVQWRNGGVSVVSDAKSNRIYEIDESVAVPATQRNPTEAPQPLFEDVSHLIAHSHHEDHFDDFRRQPLLPDRLSTMGPGLAWYDLDADGDEDLVVGSGKGGQLACLSNEGEAGFRPFNRSLTPLTANHDQATVLGWTRNDEAASLLVGNSNFEDVANSKSAVSQHDFKGDKFISSSQIEGDESSIGPMAMADYDNDGDLDLLIAGRSIPGRYPEPASARLYLNHNNIFEYDSLRSAPLQKLGLISGAVFSDLNADGDSDLVLAAEWGPVMVFHNNEGHFIDATKELEFDKYHGRWHGVTTGDLNGDGKLDIVATNWGLNSKYENRYSDKHPWTLFYGDFDNNGLLDIVEGYFDSHRRVLLPERDLFGMMSGLLNIRMRMPDHGKYSRSTLPEIIGPKLAQASHVQANTFAHMVFFNRGSNFEAVPLPKEAQFSPAFHVSVADLDGDGHEDLFLSQNFFAVQLGTSRSDAGRGLFLKGDGAGGLQPVAGQVSGIEVYGEQRGAALCDYDQDGRVDVAVSQNGAATKLYHNVGAKPGMRIRLLGPKENPAGIGATIRLRYSDGYGPAREIHAGAGYWSQDSVVQVMGFRDKATGVWVRWPGGQITEQPVRTGESEIVVRFNEAASR